MMFSSRNRAHRPRILPMGAAMPGTDPRSTKLSRPMRLLVILLLALASWAILYLAARLLASLFGSIAQ